MSIAYSDAVKFPRHKEETRFLDWDATCIRRPATRIDGCAVAWINKRWFAEQGFDTRIASVVANIESELIEKFAFQIDSEERPLEPGTVARKRSFYIDGYGSTGLVLYGGSGRAGVLDGYQVKGIGRTPFCGKDVDWYHSHGFIWLDEALREAVFSELARHEAPCGAIPTIAVLAVDESLQDPGGVWRQRALLVRPFEARPCHFQRALLHSGEGGKARGFEHEWDVNRVTSNVKTQEVFHDIHGGDAVRRIAKNYGSQAAYAHVAGWFHGGFSSSNLTMSGKYIDFGSARFVSTLCGRHYENFGQTYGSELESSIVTLDSIGFYLSKYSRGRVTTKGESIALLLNEYRKWVVTLFAFYVGVQRSEVINCGEHVIDAIASSLRGLHSVDESAAAANEDIVIHNIIDSIAKKINAFSGWSTESAMLRWRHMRRRPGASRECVERVITSALHERRHSSLQVEIDAVIAQNRRIWWSIPEHYLPLGCSSDGISEIVDCLDVSSKIGDQMAIFSWSPFPEAEALGSRRATKPCEYNLTIA